jgi:hypothetical protein
MAHANCFRKDKANMYGGDYIATKRAKAIFKGAVDVAKNNGVLKKKNGSQYRGEIYTSTNSNCPKLIGASSYEQLHDVTMGKYIVDPLTFEINGADNLWVGNLVVEELTGIITLDASFGGIHNTFTYPPEANASQKYPIYGTTPQAGGMYVDPSYNLLYPSGAFTDNIRGSCYLKEERSFFQHVHFITENNTGGLIDLAKMRERYVDESNHIIGAVYYPAPISLSCEKLWENGKVV